jgi:hypothetical protein
MMLLVLIVWMANGMCICMGICMDGWDRSIDCLVKTICSKPKLSNAPKKALTSTSATSSSSVGQMVAITSIPPHQLQSMGIVGMGNGMTSVEGIQLLNELTNFAQRGALTDGSLFPLHYQVIIHIDID